MHRVGTTPCNRSRASLRGAIGLLALSTALNLAGCPVPADPSDPNIDGSNGSFDSASLITLDDAGRAEFDAAIDSGSDTDLFALGMLEPGDRVVVDVQTTSGDLDPVAGIFDEQENLHAFNDDREPDTSDLNPRLDIVIRGAAGPYFLGVAAFQGGSTTGGYHAIVEITRGDGAIQPDPQIVFLEWRGGSGVVIANVKTFDLDPFDAAALGLSTERTGEMKDRIEQLIVDRYAGFSLTVLNSDDDSRPSGAHSTIYFGGTSSRAFAISEQIDTQNSDKSDNAIIFTDGFADAFGRTLSFNEMATAIGNTAAHEIGHLIGLVHTKDCDSLMDTTCGNSSLLRAQQFKQATLDDSVFPLGAQNAIDLIAFAIGLDGA